MSERPLAAITGASSGIGATFARKLAARGYDLLLIARRQERLRSLAAELSDLHGIDAAFLTADLGADADLERVADRIEHEPRLSLFINNAGFGIHGFFHETDAHAQQQLHRVHIIATMRLTHAALANLVPRNAGGVINVASVAGFMQSPTSVTYCASKTWISSFTEGIAIEMSIKAPKVTIQSLCPGFTLSEFHDVVKMDRSAIPASLWMPADFVVDQSLRDFDRRKLFSIPGWRYQLIAFVMNHVPGPLKRSFAAGPGRRMRRASSVSKITG
ncbi:MAG TPA: SDR family oxidoreductase [Bryobacteraceae bacterium]|nr:SDR family oxidoreductase [Bryobacteraceae bacterium]